MKIPKEHQLKCEGCGQIVDMRDLSQVFSHEECNGDPVDYDKIEQIEFVSSKKLGSTEMFINKIGTINLN